MCVLYFCRNLGATPSPSMKYVRASFQGVGGNVWFNVWLSWKETYQLSVLSWGQNCTGGCIDFWQMSTLHFRVISRLYQTEGPKTSYLRKSKTVRRIQNVRALHERIRGHEALFVELSQPIWSKKKITSIATNIDKKQPSNTARILFLMIRNSNRSMKEIYKTHTDSKYQTRKNMRTNNGARGQKREHTNLSILNSYPWPTLSVHLL